MVSSHSTRWLQEPARLDDAGAARVSHTDFHCAGEVPQGYERKGVLAVQPAWVSKLRSGHDCIVTVPAELSELLLRAGR